MNQCASGNMRGSRLLFVTGGLHLGGAEVVLCQLAGALQRMGAECLVLCITPPGALARVLQASKVEVRSLNIESAFDTLGGFLRAWRMVRSFKPALIQGWMYDGNLLSTFLQATARRQARLVWGVRSLMFFSKLKGRFVNRMCAVLSHVSPDVVVCVSRRAVEVHSRAGYSRRKLEHIPNGVDTERFSPSSEDRSAVRCELGLRKENVAIGHLGRFHPAKDYNCFIKAAVCLKQHIPAVKFVLCGSELTPENEQIGRELKERRLEGEFMLLGPRSDPQRILNSFDVFLLSSRSEAFPNSLLEAMATGIPCLATDVGDCGAILGACGKAVPPGQPEALAAACMDLLRESAESRRRLGMAARARVIEHFSIEQCVRAHEALYRRLLRPKPLAEQSDNQHRQLEP